MQPIQQVSFTAQPELQAEANRIAQARMLAQAMQAESMRDTPTQTIGRMAVKQSPLQSVSRLANAFLATKMMGDADAKEASLIAARNKQVGDWMQAMPQAKSVDTTLPDDIEGPQAGTITQAPNKAQMLSWAMQGAQTGNPLAQQIAMATLQSQIKQQTPYNLRPGEIRMDENNNIIARNVAPEKPAELFSRLDPKDWTPESLRKWSVSKDYADLVPVRKKEIGPSGVAYDPYQVPQGAVFNDPNKLVNLGPDGQPVVNQPYFNARRDLAKESATRVNVPVSVNTEKTLFGNIADKVGEQVAGDRKSALSAAQSINSLNQLDAALNSGKVITGTGADARIAVNQLAQTLGVGGKDQAEVLANTRLAVQALSRQSLEAAQLMAGQGAITERERELIAKASSGQINMTPPELRALSGALRKTAAATIQRNQQNVERLRQNPNSAILAPFMDVPQPAAQPQGTRLRFDSQGNMVE